MTSEEPTWTIRGEGDDRRVYLSGPWTLFAHTHAKNRLEREFDQLDQPRALAWDLSEVEALDSAGALLLWRLWGQRWPEALECRKAYRQWFERFKALPAPTPNPRLSVMRLLETFGAGLVSLALEIWGLFRLVGTVFSDLGRSATHPRLIPWREISASIYRTGVSSMLILGVTGFVIGIVMSLQLGVTLSQFGANEKIIGLLGLAVMRELGPVIAGVIQAGRAGSSITAGIAGMHLTEELDALRTFGGYPTLRLVVPKVVAMAVVMPLLVVWTDFTELLGGMATAQLDLGIPHTLFIAKLPNSVSIFNFWLGLAKGSLFGITIGVVGSYFGLTSGASTDSLSGQTTKSVVVGLTLILILDAASGALLAKIGILGG